MLAQHEIDWIVKHGTRKQLLALDKYLSNPLFAWKPRPDKLDLNDEQASFLNNQDEGIMVAIGGTGSGKSSVGAVKTARYLLSTPPPVDYCPWWIVSVNLEMASGNCWTQKLRQFIPETDIEGIKWNNLTKAQPLSVRLKPHANGKRYIIDFKSAQSDLMGLQGTEAYGVWVDEYVPMEILREVQARVRVKNEDGTTPRGSFFYTLTPMIYEPEFQEIYDDRENRAGWNFYHLNSECNEHLPAGYLDRLCENELDERKATRRYGAFASFTGAVYPMFNTKLHVCEPYPIPKEWRTCRGLDPGLGKKFCCVWAAKDPFADRWVIYDEYWQDATTFQQHAENIKNRHPKFEGMTYIDPARPDVRDELAFHGITSYNAVRAVELGINEVRRYMACHHTGEPKLHVFKNCERLIKEMKGYRWHPMRHGEPVKENDDAVDSMRYALASDRHDVNPKIGQSKAPPRFKLAY